MSLVCLINLKKIKMTKKIKKYQGVHNECNRKLQQSQPSREEQVCYP